jgi:hypothetical protein
VEGFSLLIPKANLARDIRAAAAKHLTPSAEVRPPIIIEIFTNRLQGLSKKKRKRMNALRKRIAKSSSKTIKTKKKVLNIKSKTSNKKMMGRKTRPKKMA